MSALVLTKVVAASVLLAGVDTSERLVVCVKRTGLTPEVFLTKGLELSPRLNLLPQVEHSKGML
jgi:hypothetical protein